MAPVHEIWTKLASNEADFDGLLAACLRVGEINATTLAQLDAAHAESFGIPEPTDVRTTAVEGKAILVMMMAASGASSKIGFALEPARNPRRMPMPPLDLPELGERKKKEKAKRKIAKKINKNNSKQKKRTKKMDRYDSEYTDTSPPEGDVLGDVIFDLTQEGIDLGNIILDKDELEFLFEGPDKEDGTDPEQEHVVIKTSQLILERKAANAPDAPEIIEHNPPLAAKAIMSGYGGPGTGFLFIKDPDAPHGVKIKVPDMPLWEDYSFALNQRWNKRLAELEACQEANGHCDVTKGNCPNRPLVNWVDRQRRSRRCGSLSGPF